MAEEKKKDGDGKADGKRKKGLSPLILVALGAAAGGAGVVFAVPPKAIEVKAPEPPKVVDYTHPDAIQHEFNPRSKAGNSISRVQFKFVYTAREDMAHEAFERIKEQWDQLNSNVLVLLKSRSTEELRSEAGVQVLGRELADDLDRTLFAPGAGEERIARVDRIIWSSILTQ